jgi:serine/threonine protein phosphatase PrpC
MGGHAAGEVASAATIQTLAPLDAEDPGPDLVGVLSDAVSTANLRLQELIISDPAIEGMGTTLTALLWSDGYAALCHIGDSRAYLLRDGQFVQITHDHTLVQSLVDEGKITEDDVATHPHRSLLLRALDGRTIAEPDLAPLETFPGDRYLLCSDGLSGVVTEQTLHQTLSSMRDPDQAAVQLVELAIRGGGPDNITVIVADVVDTRNGRVPPTWQPVFAGAAANGAPADLRPPSRQSSPATRAMRLSRTAPQPTLPDEPTTGVWSTSSRDGYTGTFDAQSYDPGGPAGFERSERPGNRDGRTRNTAAFDQVNGSTGLDSDRDTDRGDRPRRPGGHRARRPDYDEDDDYGRRGRRRWPIVSAALVLLVLLVGGGAYGFWWYNQKQYYVGEQDGFVAIFRGTDQSMAGISMSSLLQRTNLSVSQLTAGDQASVAQTISQGSVTAAQQVIDELKTHANDCQQQWQALEAWQAKNVTYQRELVAARGTKIKVPASDSPGMEPAAADSDCAPAAAFDIPASALPTAQPSTAPATTPTSPSATPARTPTTKTSSSKASPAAALAAA